MTPEYRHGTGHGVGHFLNVHEGKSGSFQFAEDIDMMPKGPQGIGTRIGLLHTALLRLPAHPHLQRTTAPL
jgi:Xaa-Pro aminopeptidase